MWVEEPSQIPSRLVHQQLVFLQKFEGSMGYVQSSFGRADDTCGAEALESFPSYTFGVTRPIQFDALLKQITILGGVLRA